LTLVAFPMGSADGNLIQLSLHYDDVTLLIEDITAHNDAGKWPITFTAYSRGLSGQPAEGTIIFGPKSYAVKAGDTVDNVHNLGMHMVSETTTGKYGTITTISPPYTYSFEG
jgi:hypothetical protein